MFEMHVIECSEINVKSCYIVVIFLFSSYAGVCDGAAGFWFSSSLTSGVPQENTGLMVLHSFIFIITLSHAHKRTFVFVFLFLVGTYH